MYRLIDDVSGTAAYEGAAAGKFALVDNVDGTADGGHWTAKAELMVDFGPRMAPARRAASRARSASS